MSNELALPDSFLLSSHEMPAETAHATPTATIAVQNNSPSPIATPPQKHFEPAVSKKRIFKKALVKALREKSLPNPSLPAMSPLDWFRNRKVEDDIVAEPVGDAITLRRPKLSVLDTFRDRDVQVPPALKNAIEEIEEVKQLPFRGSKAEKEITDALQKTLSELPYATVKQRPPKTFLGGAWALTVALAGPPSATGMAMLMAAQSARSPQVQFKVDWENKELPSLRTLVTFREDDSLVRALAEQHNKQRENDRQRPISHPPANIGSARTLRTHQVGPNLRPKATIPVDPPEKWTEQVKTVQAALAQSRG